MSDENINLPIRRSFSSLSETDEQADIDDNSQSKSIEATRQLKRLSMDNTGRFLENWKPESSHRETRKLTRKLYKEGGVRKHTIYDENGVLKRSKIDFCDCLEEGCPGCHFPCPKCNSAKCGHECRNNRKWAYESVEIEGSRLVIRNKYK